jgi:hypothetical protein
MQVHIVLFEYEDGAEVINVFKDEMDAKDYAENRNNMTEKSVGRCVVETYEVID